MLSVLTNNTVLKKMLGSKVIGDEYIDEPSLERPSDGTELLFPAGNPYRSFDLPQLLQAHANHSIVEWGFHRRP